MTINMINRRKRVLDHLNEIGCNKGVVFQPENIFYLTGFWGEGVVVIDNDKTILFSPQLEYNRAKNESKYCEIVRTERGDKLIDAVKKELDARKFCSDCREYQIVDKIRKELVYQENMILDENQFLKARMIKDDEEIKLISHSAKIIDKLFQFCTHEIKIGVTERKLQAKLIFETFENNATTTSYNMTINPFIIAGGPNGSFPHANISDREFQTGDFIVVDLTLRYNGYIADATRTFGLGKIEKKQERIYNIVKESQKKGLEAVKIGTEIGNIDKSCREFISDSGYGKYFIHSTGHGIGIEVHEPPWIRKENKELLKKNMTITIEPGIYIESKFGIRIEDSILVREGKKITNFNSFTKDLLVL
ncbi:MAG: Xaa-Pro aminopeptidase [Nitrososphaeraceae archaeon]|nr:Xaa-Pro aminopeptidase [Nitrososphaeraceae archaeon]